MRIVKYEVRKPDGTAFITTDYLEAKNSGKIEKTFLVDVTEKINPPHLIKSKSNKEKA